MPKIPVYDSSANLTKEAPQRIVDPEIYAQKGKNFESIGKGIGELGDKIQKIDDINRKASATMNYEKKKAELDMLYDTKPNLTEEDIKTHRDESAKIAKESRGMIGASTDGAEFDLYTGKDILTSNIKFQGKMIKQKADSTKANVNEQFQYILDKKAKGADTTNDESYLNELMANAKATGVYGDEEFQKLEQDHKNKYTENYFDNKSSTALYEAVKTGDKSAVMKLSEEIAKSGDLTPEQKNKYQKSLINDLNNMQNIQKAQEKQQRIDSIMSTGEMVVGFAKNGYDDKTVALAEASGKYSPEQIQTMKAMKHLQLMPDWAWRSPEATTALRQGKKAKVYEQFIKSAKSPEELANLVDLATRDLVNTSDGSIGINDLTALAVYADDRMQSFDDPKWTEFDTAVRALTPYGPTAMQQLLKEWDKKPGTVADTAKNIQKRMVGENIPSSILMDKELPSAGMKNGALKQGTGLPATEKADMQVTGTWWETPKGEKKFVPNNPKAKKYAEASAWKQLEEQNADKTGTGSRNNGSTAPAKPGTKTK